MKFEFGTKVRDVITGFEGYVTGVSAYMTGCNQYSIVNEADKSGEYKLHWFDESRLQVVKGGKKKILPPDPAVGKTRKPGGPAIHPAPIR